ETAPLGCPVEWCRRPSPPARSRDHAVGLSGPIRAGWPLSHRISWLQMLRARSGCLARPGGRRDGDRLRLVVVLVVRVDSEVVRGGAFEPCEGVARGVACIRVRATIEVDEVMEPSRAAGGGLPRERRRCLRR